MNNIKMSERIPSDAISDSTMNVVATKWYLKRHTIYTQLEESLGSWERKPFSDTTKDEIKSRIAGILAPVRDSGVLEYYSIDAHATDDGSLEAVVDWKDADSRGWTSSTLFRICCGSKKED